MATYNFVQCRYMEYGIVSLCFKGLQAKISIKHVFLSLKILSILVQTVHTVALCALCGFWVFTVNKEPVDQYPEQKRVKVSSQTILITFQFKSCSCYFPFIFR